MVPPNLVLPLLLCHLLPLSTGQDIQPQPTNTTAPASTLQQPDSAQDAGPQSQNGEPAQATAPTPGKEGTAAPSTPHLNMPPPNYPIVLKPKTNVNLEDIFQQILKTQQAKQKSLLDAQQGGGGDAPGPLTEQGGLTGGGEQNNLLSQPNQPQAETPPPNNPGAAPEQQPGQQETGNFQIENSAEGTLPTPTVRVVNIPPVATNKPEVADGKETKDQRLFTNDTLSNSRARQTLNSMKFATLAVFMAMMAVAVLVMVVISTLSKRRRRQYDRCRGLGDDCELRSNFQLVNQDERLGIRTSSNYLM